MATHRKRSRYTPQQRQEYVAEFERSGLTQAEFCRRAKLEAVTFSRWRRTLTPSPPAFAEIQVRAPLPVTASTVPMLGDAAVLHLVNGAKLELALGGESAWAGLGLMLKTFQA